MEIASLVSLKPSLQLWDGCWFSSQQFQLRTQLPAPASHVPSLQEAVLEAQIGHCWPNLKQSNNTSLFQEVIRQHLQDWVGDQHTGLQIPNIKTHIRGELTQMYTAGSYQGHGDALGFLPAQPVCSSTNTGSSVHTKFTEQHKPSNPTNPPDMAKRSPICLARGKRNHFRRGSKVLTDNSV